jgi:hypothetical protein
MGNAKFKLLVKAGQIVVGPRADDAIELQAMRDEQNARKAQIARELSKKFNK